jgi:hypothetical protein
VLSRGNVYVGSTHPGWLVVASAGLGSDVSSLISTNSTYGVANSPFGAAPADCTTLKEPRFPYPTVSCPKTRIVASAVRVRYTGTELKRGGKIILWANNSPVFGTSASAYFPSVEELKSLPDCRIFPVTRAWRTIAWNPSDPENCAYLPCDSTSSTGRDVSYGQNQTLFGCFTGEAGNEFEFERISYYEMVPVGPGREVPNVTKSHSDPVGLGIVKDFLADSYVNYGSQALEAFKGYALNAAIATMTTYTGTPAMAALPWSQGMRMSELGL